VLIVIVNYSTPRLVIDCLRSLAPQITPATRVIITDNASPDDSVPQIQSAIAANHWSFAALMPLPKNGGFAYGNNAAIRPLLAANQLPPYILLLNPDTILLPNALAALTTFMDQNPQAAIAGSRLENPDATPQISAFRFPGILSEFESGFRLGLLTRLLSPIILAPPVQDVPHKTGWVAGASFLVRREVFEKIGLLDEAYFMYYEEVDFCLRAARAGFATWYVPQSRVIHLVGQASGINSAAVRPKRTPAYVFQSRRRYFVKNHGRLYAFFADAACLAAFSIYRLRRRLQRKPDTDPPHALADFARHSVCLHPRS